MFTLVKGFFREEVLLHFGSRAHARAPFPACCTAGARLPFRPLD